MAPLYAPPRFESSRRRCFVRRVELGVADGGFATLTGDPGTGKSIALRLLTERLRALPDVLVGTVEHPQRRTMDFYRELGDLFSVPLAAHNRWAGFKALRGFLIDKKRKRKGLLSTWATEVSRLAPLTPAAA